MLDTRGAQAQREPEQYWEIKSKYRDVVLFFKVGKFYELYEDDAEIGCRELDWKMTVSGVGRHCRQVGCRAARRRAACARLVQQREHKVGRIEQLETAAQAKARGGSNAVIRRELAEVATPATRWTGTGDDAVAAPDATHILAFAEEEDGKFSNDDEQGVEGDAGRGDERAHLPQTPGRERARYSFAATPCRGSGPRARVLVVLSDENTAPRSRRCSRRCRPRRCSCEGDA